MEKIPNTIPNIIHKIWIQGYNSIPPKLKDYHEHCMVINNTFKTVFWDEKKIIKLLKANFGREYLELYHNYKIFAQKADLARYVILYIHGGIYLDMDMICKKNLKPFLNNKLFFTSDEFCTAYNRYLTGIIGAVPKHPVFLLALKNMLDRILYSYNIRYSSGTKLFYDSVQQYKQKTNDQEIEIVDRKYLHPCGILDDEMSSYTCDDCYIAHTNYSSWSLSLKFLKFITRNTTLIILGFIIIIILWWVKNKFSN